MSQEKIKVGLVGYGRLGKAYAQNLKSYIPNADLIAVCSLVEDEILHARRHLQVPYVYSSYEKMLEHTELDAIYVVSSTDQHAHQIMLALESGKHVFSEKPLAIDIETCKEVLVHSKRYPHLKAMVGFVRRYDESYSYAKKKIKEGAIGQPFLVKSQTVDKDSIAAFQMEYVNKSGGIFHDFNVHDVDLARWYLESDILKVHSIGGSFKHPEFGKKGDADNVMSTCTFENGTMAVIHASRTGMHGHDTYTEIVGTEGVLRIGRPAQKNRVEIYDQYGARRECVETFWDRFHEAFKLMAADFIDIMIHDRIVEMDITNALKATEATSAFSASFRSGEIKPIRSEKD
jgi:myo-inositol 2-dehydrogenase/D-chiro-inositol 1-dehydrogenase